MRRRRIGIRGWHHGEVYGWLFFANILVKAPGKILSKVLAEVLDVV